MMFCPKCGKEVNQAAAFCDNCGMGLQTGNNVNIQQKKVNPANVVLGILMFILGIVGIIYGLNVIF